jgi:hypothetical protein
MVPAQLIGDVNFPPRTPERFVRVGSPAPPNATAWWGSYEPSPRVRLAYP